MKKLFLSMFFATGIFLLISHGEMLWSNMLFLDEPQTHTIQKGESLSKLAKQFYGDAKRWRELALINRAPNPDHVEVGEQIMVPSAGAVSDIRKARTMTSVNSLVQDQEKRMNESSRPVTDATPSGEPQTTPEATPSSPEVTTEEPATGMETQEPTNGFEETEPAEGERTGFPWLLVIIGAVVLAAIGGFAMYRRRRAQQSETVEVTDRGNGIDQYRRRRYETGAPPASKTTEVEVEEKAR